MAALNELIAKIDNPELRAQIQAAADQLVKQKQFGLVFEDHLPECTPLYDIPVRKGKRVSLKNGKVNETYIVLKIENDKAICKKEDSTEAIEFLVDDLVVTAELGEPIYPCLKLIGEVCNAPDSDLWHTLIEADNYHALQLLEYLYAGKVDCIYIDPPYNTGAKDWKYNNDYVDSSDEYRHSKWLSMMKKRLEIAAQLLNPENSVLIVTIDEKEYLHIGCLLEELFPEANIQMISTLTARSGAARFNSFSRTNEFIYFVMIGNYTITPIENTEYSQEGDSIHWRSFRRGNPANIRTSRPSQFYPLYVNIDTNRIVEVGDPITPDVDRFTVKQIDHCVAVFPVRDDNTEMLWGVTPNACRHLVEKGYIKATKYTPDKPQLYIVQYLSSGTIKDIEAGRVTVKGYSSDGGIIADNLESRKAMPKTQWMFETHDARDFGTKILKNTIGETRFDFPKSLYAVMDCLKLFVSDKPNALIVDFFAGSGTTLHATNLLNAEDKGHRRCIIVTNNEVSDAERKDFETRGIKQGSEEWESRGIARYVTWPRTVCSIKGCNIAGEPLDGDYGVLIEEYILDEEDTVVSKTTGKLTSKKIYIKEKVQKAPLLAQIKKADGFAANAVFFKLDFLDKTRVSLGMQFKELLSTLWMKAGATGKCPTVDARVPDMLILPENKMAILTDENCFGTFTEQLAQHSEIEVVYLVTDYESSYVAMTKALEGKKTYQLYRDYLDNFRINAGRNSR